MSIGLWEILGVLIIVLILFGAGKLPAVMGDLAKGLKSFKKAMKEDEDTENKDPAEAEKSDENTPGRSV